MKNRVGVTLVEVLVVIAIIGIVTVLGMQNRNDVPNEPPIPAVKMIGANGGSASQQCESCTVTPAQVSVTAVISQRMPAFSNMAAALNGTHAVSFLGPSESTPFMGCGWASQSNGPTIAVAVQKYLGGTRIVAMFGPGPGVDTFYSLVIPAGKIDMTQTYTLMPVVLGPECNWPATIQIN